MIVDWFNIKKKLLLSM